SKLPRSSTQSIDLVSVARLVAITLSQHHSQRQSHCAFNLHNQFQRRRQSASPKISYNLEPGCSAFLSFESLRDRACNNFHKGCHRCFTSSVPTHLHNKNEI